MTNITILQQPRDCVWSTIPDKPLRPWGSALSPLARDEIITPALIGPTKRITRPELRGPACPTCGGQQYFCECFPEGDY